MTSKLEAGRKKTGGRKRGTPNKATALLKDAILAAGASSHPDGLEGYLTLQAMENPTAFMTLLGKVLPLQIAGDPSNPMVVTIIERKIVKADN